jgi:hypothetical protein
MKIILKDGTELAVTRLTESVYAKEYSLSMTLDPANHKTLGGYANDFRADNIGAVEVVDDEGTTVEVLEDYVSASVGRSLETGQFAVNVTLHKDL